MSAKIVPLFKGSCWTKPVNGLAKRMVTEVNALANVYNGELAGYVIVAVNGKGEWSLGARAAKTKDHPIGSNMLGGIAQAAIQRELMADPAAVDVLIRHGLVINPPKDKD